MCALALQGAPSAALTAGSLRLRCLPWPGRSAVFWLQRLAQVRLPFVHRARLPLRFRLRPDYAPTTHRCTHRSCMHRRFTHSPCLHAPALYAQPLPPFRAHTEACNHGAWAAHKPLRLPARYGAPCSRSVAAPRWVQADSRPRMMLGPLLHLGGFRPTHARG